MGILDSVKIVKQQGVVIGIKRKIDKLKAKRKKMFDDKIAREEAKLADAMKRLSNLGGSIPANEDCK